MKQANTQTIVECYPASDMTSSQMLALAQEYQNTASAIENLRKQNQSLNCAPYRFAAIHSIELYLNAYLLYIGKTSLEIRRHSHNLNVRQELAAESGLVLRKKTVSLLQKMTANREYLIVRYDINRLDTLTSVAQLESVLNELSKKVIKRLSQ